MAGVAAVSNAIFKLAMEGNVTAQIFFLKCKGGWRETTNFQISPSTPDEGDDRERQLRLLRAMTPEERQRWRAFQHELEQRIKNQETAVAVKVIEAGSGPFGRP